MRSESPLFGAPPAETNVESVVTQVRLRGQARQSRLWNSSRPGSLGGLVQKRLVKGVLQKPDFEEVYRLLDTPATEGDCGRLCGSMCCQEYEPGVGMYLLPGEECMFTGREPWLTWKYHVAKKHDFPPEWNGLVPFVLCRGTCPRDRRPIQCRTFPLMPYLDESGENLTMRLDSLTGSLICPLVREPEKHVIRPEFRERALEAWRILLKDPLIRLDVAAESRRLDEDQGSAWRKLLR